MKIAIITTDNRQNYRHYDRPAPYFGTAPEALMQGFSMLPENEVHVISCTQRPMTSPEKLAPNIWFHSLHVPQLGWLRTGYLGCIRAVRKKMRELQPDIVHGQGTERDCAISSVFSGFPSVLTVHGNMRLVAQVNHSKPFSYNWIMARLETMTIPRSAGVVCISNYTREAVESLARKTWVLPNAVDATFFDVPKEPSGKMTILCVGVVCPRKNQNAFILALDPLAQLIQFEVVFLGSAAREDKYGAEFFELLKTRPWCRHEGFADRPKLKEHLKTARLLALPSLEDNCPMVVLEAMAASVPVVAANVGGLPDLVQPEVTGLLCDPLNPESIRSAVERTIADDTLNNSFSTHGKEQALKRFHPKAIASRHLEIYKEVLHERT